METDRVEKYCFMLPAKNRLKKREEIEKILREGKRCRESFILLKFLKNSLSQSRFAFVVSKKVARKAVTRNQTKRLFREAVRRNFSKIETGVDCVLIVLPGFKIQSFQVAEKHLHQLLQRAKLWRSNF